MRFHSSLCHFDYFLVICFDFLTFRILRWEMFSGNHLLSLLCLSTTEAFLHSCRAIQLRPIQADENGVKGGAEEVTNPCSAQTPELSHSLVLLVSCCRWDTTLCRATWLCFQGQCNWLQTRVRGFYEQDLKIFGGRNRGKYNSCAQNLRR